MHVIKGVEIANSMSGARPKFDITTINRKLNYRLVELSSGAYFTTDATHEWIDSAAVAAAAACIRLDASAHFANTPCMSYALLAVDSQQGEDRGLRGRAGLS